MALIAGVGVGLFVLLLFAALLVITCILASAHRRGPYARGRAGADARFRGGAR